MNKIIRALVCGSQASLTVMDTTRLVNDAIAIHNTDREASVLFGGMLTFCAYLACGLKSANTGVSVTVKAKEGDGAISVSADSDLHVRGFADGSCTRSLAGGSLTVVREEGGAMPFVGTCEIASDNLSETAEIYFQQSEQIPTAVALTCEMGADGSCLSAGGVIIQLLPDADDEAVAKAGDAFNLYKESADALADMGADGVFEKFFSPLGISDKYELHPGYMCNCSEQKISRILLTVGREELLGIIKEQGAVSVHCHYCNKDYVFGKEQIDALFSTDGK